MIKKMNIPNHLWKDIKQMIDFTITDIYNRAYIDDIKNGWIDILKEIQDLDNNNGV